MRTFLASSLLLIQICVGTSIGFAQTPAEIEFWQSVKSSNDVDMLNAYLREYPDGKFKSLAIIKIKKLGGTVSPLLPANTDVEPSATDNEKYFGEYFGLIDNKYKSTTSIYVANGKLSGEYYYYEDGTKTTGQFTDSEVDYTSRVVIFSWKDKYGTGKVRMVFDKSYLRFNGTWGTGREYTGAGTWNGKVTQNKKLALNVGKEAQTIIMANKSWCARSGNASKMDAQQCLDKDGIPTINQSSADWIVNTYFTKYKKHKAFAISDNSWGVGAYEGNPVEAKQLALYDCNLRAKKATTCRVVNLNGQRTEYSDYSKSSDPVFSTSGEISDITGRYKLLLHEWDAGQWEGVLKLDANSSDIQGDLRLCWGQRACVTYEIKKIHTKARGRYFHATLIRTKVSGAPRMPEKYHLLISFSSDTSLVKGRLNRGKFDGSRYSD